MPEVHDVAPAQDTRLSTPTDDSLGPKEHVDAALQKANDGTDANKNPKLFAGKFKTREELLKGIANVVDKAGDDAYLESAYKYFEKRIGAPADKRTNDLPVTDPEPSASGTKSDEPSSDTAGTPAEIPADAAAQSATIDFDALAHEFAAEGGLTEASYEDLNKKGFTRQMVDTYLEGINATLNKMYSRVGTKENYQKMLEWGVATLPKADQEAFDKGITGGTEAERNLAIDAMWTRYTKVNGNPPTKRLTPQGNEGHLAYSGFRSTAELVEAQKDPRYAKDPAYRAEVMARLKVSKI